MHTLPASERLERLVVAASSLITEVSLEGVLQRVVEVAAEVIGARYAAIGVLGPDGRLLENFTTYGIEPEQRAPAPCRLGVCGQHLAPGQGALRMPRLSVWFRTKRVFGNDH